MTKEMMHREERFVSRLELPWIATLRSESKCGDVVITLRWNGKETLAGLPYACLSL
jgi:hypothetical protein